MSQPLVLIADDEPSFLDSISILLRSEGFRTVVARDGRAAVEAFQDAQPDLVLLDVMMPVMSGIDVCRRLRSESNVPIIMVTARDSELDAVVGLEIGADDYVSKPFRSRELVARIRAALRRQHINETSADTGDVDDGFHYGRVSMDLARHEVTVDGVLAHLPRKEFDLLALLMKNAGMVLTRQVLIDRVWGFDYVGDTKTLDVHIKRLRAKIEVDPAEPDLLHTVRGVGYRFEPLAPIRS